MTTTTFLFDPDDLTPKEFEVPPGITELARVYLVGGGEYLDGAVGMVLEGVPVTPGDTLTVDLGGPSNDVSTDGGYGGGGRTGGEGGGGYDPPNGNRGYGGGGASEILRGDLSLLAVAGGAGGRAGGSGYYQDFWPFVGDTGLPDETTPPRRPDAQPADTTLIAYDLWTPGLAGGVAIGGAGNYVEAAVEDGTYWGSGGGGGGYVGGSSGGIGFYHYVDGAPTGTFGATFPGRAGASFLPAEAAAWAMWLGASAGDGIYEWIGDRRGGFARFEYGEPSRQGWSVGRKRM